MSEGTLSQEEIDALLQGGAPSAPPIEEGVNLAASVENNYEQDIPALTVLLQSSQIEQQATLRAQVGENFSLGGMTVQYADILPLQNEVVFISADFTNSINEQHAYILTIPDAQKLLTRLMGMEDVEIADASLGALQEVFEQLASTVANALSAELGNVRLDRVMSQKLSVSNIPVFSGGVVYAQYNMLLDEQPIGVLYEAFSAQIVKLLKKKGDSGSPVEDIPNLPPPDSESVNPLAALGSATAGAGMSFGSAPQSTSIRSVQFPQLQESSADMDKGNLGLLMDVSMEMTVELGRTRKMVRDILSMGEGTIIELDKVAGEPIDILVNKKLIARGEVVIIDENFGVRVTEII